MPETIQNPIRFLHFNDGRFGLELTKTQKSIHVEHHGVLAHWTSQNNNNVVMAGWLLIRGASIYAWLRSGHYGVDIGTTNDVYRDGWLKRVNAQVDNQFIEDFKGHERIAENLVVRIHRIEKTMLRQSVADLPHHSLAPYPSTGPSTTHMHPSTSEWVTEDAINDDDDEELQGILYGRRDKKMSSPLPSNEARATQRARCVRLRASQCEVRASQRSLV